MTAASASAPGLHVVVTGVGGAAGRSLVGQLQDRGHRVTGADCRAVHGLRCPTSVVPAAGDPAYVPVLRGLVADVRADLVIPTVTEELPVLAGVALGRAGLMIGSRTAVLAAADKWTTSLRLAEAGVAVPRTVRASPALRWAELIRTLGAPLISKPRYGRGGRGVVLVRAADEGTVDALGEDRIVQSFAGGVEYAVNLFASGTATPASPDAWYLGPAVVLEKTALAQGRIGNGLAVRRVPAPDVEDLARRAVRALGLTGPVDVDVRRDGSGSPLVLEVNARFGAHSARAPEVLDALLDEWATSTARAA